jgi:hypothetical protein
MWRYFVDATADIIEEVGLENVIARKIAEKAGYTVLLFIIILENSHI